MDDFINFLKSSPLYNITNEMETKFPSIFQELPLNMKVCLIALKYWFYGTKNLENFRNSDRVESQKKLESEINSMIIKAEGNNDADLFNLGIYIKDVVYGLYYYKKLTHICAFTGMHIFLYKLKYDFNLNINIKDELGIAPIHYACLTGQYETFNWLVANNIMIDTIDRCGRNILYYACWGGKSYNMVYDMITMYNFKVETYLLYTIINPPHVDCSTATFLNSIMSESEEIGMLLIDYIDIKTIDCIEELINGIELCGFNNLLAKINSMISKTNYKQQV